MAHPWRSLSVGPPAAYSVGAQPDISRQLDLEGDEYAELSTPDIAAQRRSFRAGENSGHRIAGDIAVGDNMTDRAESHASRGTPDFRHTGDAPHGQNSPAGPASPVQPAMPEVYLNERQNNADTFREPPPDRPRQGFTGSDPARPSQQTRAYLMRPFDKGIAEHPGALVRADMQPNLASTPFTRPELDAGLPNATGRTGTAKQGYSGHPNTFRLLPQAWDTALLDTGGPAVSSAMPDPAQVAATGQRAKGWRL